MKKLFLLAGFFVSIILASCTTTTPQPKAKHVIWIGLDGWGSYSVAKAEMPVTKQFMNEGAYTLKKRTVLPSSSSVNWASMFMGAGPELHGWTDCCSEKVQLEPRTVNQHGIFPTVFQLYRDADPKAEIGCVYDWSGIKFVVDTLALNYHEQGPDYKQYPDVLTEMAVKYITEKKPNLFAVIYDDPDHVGHTYGHGTAEYYEKLKKLDQNIGKLVDAVKTAGIYDETVFVITSDHGGIDTGHGGKTMNEMETPFIIAGKGIKKGGYCFDNISMMQFDCASTLVELLALQQPDVWIGRSMPVFE